MTPCGLLQARTDNVSEKRSPFSGRCLFVVHLKTLSVAHTIINTALECRKSHELERNRPVLLKSLLPPSSVMMETVSLSETSVNCLPGYTS